MWNAQRAPDSRLNSTDCDAPRRLHSLDSLRQLNLSQVWLVSTDIL